MCMRSQELRAALRDSQCPRTFSARAAGAGAGGGLAVDSRGAGLCGARRRLAHYVVVKDSHAQAAAEHAGIAGSSAAAAGCQLSALEEHAGDHCRHLGVLHFAPVRLGLWAVCGQGAGRGASEGIRVVQQGQACRRCVHAQPPRFPVHSPVYRPQSRHPCCSGSRRCSRCLPGTLGSLSRRGSRQGKWRLHRTGRSKGA